MYNRRHVTEILNEFHQSIEERMKDYLDSVAYAMVMKFKGRGYPSTASRLRKS